MFNSLWCASRCSRLQKLAQPRSQLFAGSCIESLPAIEQKQGPASQVFWLWRKMLAWSAPSTHGLIKHRGARTLLGYVLVLMLQRTGRQLDFCADTRRRAGASMEVDSHSAFSWSRLKNEP